MNFENFNITSLFKNQNKKTDARLYVYDKILKKIYYLITVETKKKGNRQMFFTFQRKHPGMPLISDPQSCKMYCCQALQVKGFQLFPVSDNTVRITWTHIDRMFTYKQNLRTQAPGADRIVGDMQSYYKRINKKF